MTFWKYPALRTLICRQFLSAKHFGLENLETNSTAIFSPRMNKGEKPLSRETGRSRSRIVAEVVIRRRVTGEVFGPSLRKLCLEGNLGYSQSREDERNEILCLMVDPPRSPFNFWAVLSVSLYTALKVVLRSLVVVTLGVVTPYYYYYYYYYYLTLGWLILTTIFHISL